jgi:hypothetical protein
MLHKKNYREEYLLNKNKYESLKKQTGGNTCEYYVNEMLGTIPDDHPLYTHSNKVGFSYVNKDNNKRNNAITCGIAYVLHYHEQLKLDNGRAKLIIDGMNIIRNKYILLIFLAETLYYKIEKGDIVEDIFKLILNPVEHQISINLIILLIPIIISLLKVQNTDIYITFQNSEPILEIYSGEKLRDMLESIFGFSNPVTNTFFLMGVSCFIDDGKAPNRGANVLECHQDGSIHNEADDIVCVFLTSLYKERYPMYINDNVSIWSYDNYSWFTMNYHSLRDYMIYIEVDINDKLNKYRPMTRPGPSYPKGSIAFCNPFLAGAHYSAHDMLYNSLNEGIIFYIGKLLVLYNIKVPDNVKRVLLS